MKDGKLFSVIPTAIANTAVIRVHPTEASRFEIQPGPKELQLISQHLEDTLRVLNAGKVANDQPKPLGTADKMAQSIKGLL